MKRSRKKTPSTESKSSVHGVLVDVFGVGILLVGPSGVGKSECALDLVAKGHRLVADDLILIDNTGRHIRGRSPEITQCYLEVRGLGILNVRDLYGAASVREEKAIDLVVELVPVSHETEFDRLGVKLATYKLLGQDIPFVRIPFWLGRNITTMVEVAARNQILKWSGRNSAIEFEAQHRKGQCGPS